MLACKVIINGSEFELNGFEEWEILSASVSPPNKRSPDADDQFQLSVVGFARSSSANRQETVRFGDVGLRAGDEIVLRVVEVEDTNSDAKNLAFEKAS